MITPTVGRIVWFYSTVKDAPVNAAIITRVWSDRCVNLRVFGHDGDAFGKANVPLVQPNDESPGGEHCAWMPYQVKKDTGSESGEKEAGTSHI